MWGLVRCYGKSVKIIPDEVICHFFSAGKTVFDLALPFM